MSRKFAHLDHDYLRDPSPAIWKNFPDGMADLGYGGLHIWNDFTSLIADAGGSAAATISPDGRWELYTDTGQTINHGTDIVITDPSTLTALTDDAAAGYDVDVDWDVGTWVFAGDGTDEDESGIKGQELFIMNKLSLKRLAFEWRLKLATVADATGAYFCGLSDEQPGDSSLVNSTGELTAASNYLGFQILSADGNAWRPVYQAGGQTKQLKGTAVATAAKYIKLGFVLDLTGASATPNKRGKFFVNGVEHSTYITQANFEAATFPNDVAMGLAFFRKMTSVTDVVATLDWVKGFMEIDRV